MKTLLSILLIVVLIVAATLLDASRLDAGDWFITLAVAALFGMALNDGGRQPVHYSSSALRAKS
jgi:hypothetical protein